MILKQNTATGMNKSEADFNKVGVKGEEEEEEG